jgi:hypothetical protein
MHLLADVVLPWYDDKLDLEQLMSVIPRGSRKTIYICKTDVGMHKSLKNDAKIWCFTPCDEFDHLIPCPKTNLL